MPNDSDLPLLGICAPRVDGAIQSESREIFENRVRLTVEALGLEKMEMAHYKAAIERIPAVVDKLAASGAQAIAINGTSLTFSFGRKFDDGLIAQITGRTGLPVTTMANSLVRGLKVLKAKRVAVATAYTEDVTNLLCKFLDEHDIQAERPEFMGITAMDMSGVTRQQLVDLSEQAMKNRKVDALVIACGGLRTRDLTVEMEAGFGVPVVSSAPAAVWGALRLVGVNDPVPDAGQLFQLPA